MSILWRLAVVLFAGASVRFGVTAGGRPVVAAGTRSPLRHLALHHHHYLAQRAAVAALRALRWSSLSATLRACAGNPKQPEDHTARPRCEQIPWPSVGSSHGHHRAVLMAVRGQNELAIDSTGHNR